jgi:drug/metabolite transporter (DMT)-like permease
MAFEVGKNPALVGVVAGCFPASATVVAVLFLGERPSLLTLCLLITVLVGVVLIGLPEKWRTSVVIDKGILLSLLPLICWGIFGALLNEPVRRIHTPHAWFVVQSLVAVVMMFGTLGLYNKGIPAIVRLTTRNKAWKFVVPAGIAIGLAEALQAFSLSSGREIIIIETLLGSYPAAYFLIAHKIFKERLLSRQWAGISVVVISIVLLSVSATS